MARQIDQATITFYNCSLLYFNRTRRLKTYRIDYVYKWRSCIFTVKAAGPIHFFRILSQRNARIMNPKNPDLRFDLMNPLRVWILQIHNPFSDFNKVTQNLFLNTIIRIWIFPKRRALSLLLAAAMLYLTRARLVVS